MLMNHKTTFVGQHSSRRFMDFEARYFKWMEGCVEPQHSRLVRVSSAVQNPTGEICDQAAFAGN